MKTLIPIAILFLIIGSHLTGNAHYNTNEGLCPEDYPYVRGSIEISCEYPETVREQTDRRKTSETIESLAKIIVCQVDTIFITNDMVSRVRPFIDEWLEYYGLDISEARLESTDIFRIGEGPYVPGDLYYWEFTDDDDRDDIYEADYSPDRRRYIQLGNCYYISEQQRFLFEGDDSQFVYIFDRDKKSVEMFMWFGTSGQAEATFWMDNDSFIIVGYDRTMTTDRFFIIHDLVTGSRYKYIIDDPSQPSLTDFNEKIISARKEAIARAIDFGKK